MPLISNYFDLTIWQGRFLNLAKSVSTWSKDPSTKVGAVIAQHKRVVSVGYNGFPAGTSDDERLYLNREEKYRRVVHAEANALLFAKGDTKYAEVYVYPLVPCSNCMAMLINAGVGEIFAPVPTPEQLSRWGDSFNSTMAMAEEADVTINLVIMPKVEY